MAIGLQGVWLHFPGGQPRLSTVLMALAILVGVSWRTRRPYLAAVAMMAWACVFEMAWQGLTTLTHGGPWSYELWFVAAVVSWPLLAHALGIRPHGVLMALAALTLAVWWAFGFESNWYGRPPFSVRDELLNELSKTLLGLAYLVGGLSVPAARPRYSPGRSTSSRPSPP